MKKYPLLFILTSPLTIYAQSIQDIRSHYKDIADKIEVCETDDDLCPLYRNELVVNSGGQSWRAVGNYLKTVTFWYTDDPAQCDECLKDGLSVLEKVIVNESGSTYKTITEFLYKDGELIFCFRKESGYSSEEQRFYFEKGTLIRYQLNDMVMDPSESDSGINNYIVDQSNSYQQIFLKSF